MFTLNTKKIMSHKIYVHKIHINFKVRRRVDYQCMTHDHSPANDINDTSTYISTTTRTGSSLMRLILSPTIQYWFRGQDRILDHSSCPSTRINVLTGTYDEAYRRRCTSILVLLRCPNKSLVFEVLKTNCVD